LRILTGFFWEYPDSDKLQSTGVSTIFLELKTPQPSQHFCTSLVCKLRMRLTIIVWLAIIVYLTVTLVDGEVGQNPGLFWSVNSRLFRILNWLTYN
jgi:hypothetical protein